MAAHILVVDDESDVETLFRQHFRHDVREGRIGLEFARSGEQALEMMREDTPRALVLSDINMPGMSGLDLLPRIKAEHPGVPVIMITAYGDASTAKVARDRGAEALLTKPVDFAALRSEITARLPA